MIMKKDILFIMYNLSGGGAEKVLIDILQNFDYDKYNVSLALIKNEGVYLSDVPKQVRILPLCNRLEFYLGFGLVKFSNCHIFNKWLFKRKLHNHYDTIISFMEGYPLVVHSYVTQNAKKNVSWVHIDLCAYHHTSQISLFSGWEEACYKKMNQIVFVSADSAKQFDKVVKVDVPKKIIYNPILRDDIVAKADQANIPKEKFVIGTVGRLAPQKSYDRLLRVAKRLKDEQYDLEFWILGEGKLKEELIALQKELCLESEVKFLGFKKPPHPYVKLFDIFLSTSITEGYPLVVCEAMCLGIPICSTKTTGPKELLGDNEYGILTDHDDESIYRGLKKLIDDKQLREHYHQKSLERARIFDIEKTMNEVYEVVEN